MAAILSRLKSYNLRDHFIRHQNFEAELMKLDSPGFENDFAWNISSWQDANGSILVRFEAVKPHEEHFLRHKNFRLVLERSDGSDLFRKDSTFRRKSGLIGDHEEGWRSYESTNLPGHFIRHRDFHLFITTNDSKIFRADATFMPIPP
jgi:hypothetical protein